MPGQVTIMQAPKVLGYQQIAAGGADTAVGLTIPDGTESVEVSVSAQAVRWRADGTNPTAAVGQPLAVGSSTIFSIQQLSALRFIAQVAGAALDATFYGR